MKKIIQLSIACLVLGLNAALACNTCQSNCACTNVIEACGACKHSGQSTDTDGAKNAENSDDEVQQALEEDNEAE